MGAGWRMVLSFLICQMQTVMALTSWDCCVRFMWDTDGESSLKARHMSLMLKLRL